MLLEITIVVYLILISNARHVYSPRQADSTESYEIDEEEYINDKFKPKELEKFLSSIPENDFLSPTIGFAKASPDILLERLIDEADEESYFENIAQRGLATKQMVLEPEEDANRHSEETL